MLDGTAILAGDFVALVEALVLAEGAEREQHCPHVAPLHSSPELKIGGINQLGMMAFLCRHDRREALTIALHSLCITAQPPGRKVDGAFRGIECLDHLRSCISLRSARRPQNHAKRLLVASFDNHSNLLNRCDKTEPRAVSASVAHGPENMAIPAYLCSTLAQSHTHFSSRTALI